jgi:tight adherence protein B
MMVLLAAATLAAACWLIFPEHRPLPVRTALPNRPKWRIPFGYRARARSAQRRAVAIASLGALAADLHAGQPAMTALERAGPTAWPHAVAAVRLGGDIGAALRLDAKTTPALAGLAACWSVTAHTGSGLATALTRLADAARLDEDVRVQLEAQLAGPRATARMLSFLPLIGLLLGIVLGADPVRWLLGDPIGWLCLIAGVGFTALGLVWTGRIARNVEQLL